MHPSLRPLLAAPLACALLAAGPAPAAFNEQTACHVLDFAEQRFAPLAATTPGAYPKAALASGTWTTVPTGDRIAWTQGFFPAILWDLVKARGNASVLRGRADAWTRPLEVQKRNSETHDLGFKLFNSFGRAYALAAPGSSTASYYRKVLLTAAGSLAKRFDSRVGIVNCCAWNPDWHLPLVADTMMNLELLLWGAAQPGGTASWRTMALSHARVTLRDLVRADGSSYHVADYLPETGEMRWRGTYQGWADDSTWARGHAWIVYGFTMVYRYTGAADMLAAARRTADYWLAQLPADPLLDQVSAWDFHPAAPPLKDSSATAVVASALLELSEHLEGSDEAASGRYRDAALAMLDWLASTAYLAEGSTYPSVLLHGVGHLPASKEVDVGLIYGDQYFLEAVLRSGLLPASCPAPATATP